MFDRCLVFDIDDTLYLEMDYVRSGFQAVGHYLKKEMNLEGFYQIAWDLFEKGTRRTIFNEALKQLGLAHDQQTILNLVAVYRHHQPQIKLLPDALACLKAFHGQAAMAVITDGPPSSQQAKVQALQLEQWINPIILTATLGDHASKPNPLSFQLVQNATGCQGAQCVYLADNTQKDFIAPHQMGWHTVRIQRPGGLHYHQPSGADVQWELSSFDELRKTLGWFCKIKPK